jgi:hypothetical protein
VSFRIPALGGVGNLLRSLPEPALSAVKGVEMTAKETGYRKKLNALKKSGKKRGAKERNVVEVVE